MQEEYSKVMKGLVKEILRNVDSVCKVIKNEIKDGDYSGSRINDILKNKSVKSFFAEDDLKNIEENRALSEEAPYFSLESVLKKRLEGKEVLKECERVAEFVVDFICTCVTQYGCTTHIVWIENEDIKRANKYIRIPILYEKGLLCKACELHYKINYKKSEFNREKCQCEKSYEACVREISLLEERVECYKNKIEETKGTVSKKEEEEKSLK